MHPTSRKIAQNIAQILHHEHFRSCSTRTTKLGMGNQQRLARYCSRGNPTGMLVLEYAEQKTMLDDFGVLNSCGFRNLEPKNIGNLQSDRWAIVSGLHAD